MTFTPLNRIDGFETIGYWQLRNRFREQLVEFPIGNLLCSNLRQIREIHEALRQEALRALVYVEAEKQYYRVPASHWGASSAFMEGEPSEVLFCWDNSEVPEKFHDLPILFFQDEADEWLRQIEPALEVCAARESAAQSHPVLGKWVNYALTDQCKHLVRFFHKAASHLAGGNNYLNDTDLRNKYITWLMNDKPGKKPYTYSAFRDWRRRWEGGHRPKSDMSGWELSES